MIRQLLGKCFPISERVLAFIHPANTKSRRALVIYDLEYESSKLDIWHQYHGYELLDKN